MIAQSGELLKQRALTKLAVPAFFGIDPQAVPEDVWLDDDFVTGVVLAHCRGAQQLEAVTTLDGLLKTEGQALIEESILPMEGKLGRAATQYFFNPSVA